MSPAEVGGVLGTLIKCLNVLSKDMLTTRVIVVTRLFIMALLTVVWWLPRQARGVATPAFVQESDGSTTSGRTVSAAFSSANTSGNLIVLHVIWDNTSTVSVSDSAGNRYASAVGPTRYNNKSWSAQLFYATNVAGKANSVTVTFGASLKSFGIVHAVEYSGLAASAPLDVTVAASGTAKSMNSGSVTTKNATDLLFGAGASSGGVTTAGSGFAARYLSSGSITEDRNVTATGSYSATATQNGRAWVMQLAAFKAAAADTVPPSMPTNLSATAASPPKSTWPGRPPAIMWV